MAGARYNLQHEHAVAQLGRWEGAAHLAGVVTGRFCGAVPQLAIPVPPPAPD